MSGARLAAGGRIDRSQRIPFRFDGKLFEGFAGDTVASALLAAGIRLVGRSFRLHRPRGVLSSGLEEPNALVHIRVGRYEEPNVRATQCPLRNGLEVFSQNAWPNLRWDLGALFDLLPRLWSAGFYHKTFMWPNWSWYEPVIRRMAGTGRIRSPDALVGTFTQRDCEVDVLVCGGGLAGIAAAAGAAREGASVILVQASDDVGGSVRSDSARITELTGDLGVRIFRNTIATGVFGDKIVLAVQDLGWDANGPQRCLLRIRARSLIVATGSLEQPMVFDNNDRPGVMLAGAVEIYLERYAVRPGHRVVLVTNNDSPYEYLVRWRAAGMVLPAIIDSRSTPGRVAEAAAAESHVPLIASPSSLSVSGRSEVRGIDIRHSSGAKRTIPCDLVATSAGWVPSVHLYSQALGDLYYDKSLHAYAPVPGKQGVYVTGAAAGLRERDAVCEHAAVVGRAAAVFARQGAVAAAEVEPLACSEATAGPTYFLGRAHRQWLDFQHDVTVADAASAVEQGYGHVELFKRYTTTGMAVDQGKTSQRNSLEQLARFSHQSLRDLRPPTYRPPFVPLSLAAAAGPNVGQWYRPQRHQPCHAEHMALGAHMQDVGGWRRPLHYGTPPERDWCVEKEVRAVRTAAGLFDGSPLGKVEISGPDAREFLARICVNDLTSLAPGRVRYVILLRDSGVVMDDGTVTCVGPEEFLVTTTSGNAERTYLWMREWAECEWPRLKVIITSVTTAWGTATLAGPRSRGILLRIARGVDLSNESFPHMSFRQGLVDEVPARIHRVSFTGEMSYEISVPADQTVRLWRALQAAGSQDGLRPYGIDALNVLRTEKGYMLVGADTDGTTTALDVGWGAAIERKSQDFIGRRALALPEYQRADRLHLVGVIAVDPKEPLVNGAHLIRGSGGRSEGYLTSACFSPTLGYAIALARLECGRARMNEDLLAYDQGATTRVRIVKPIFYDIEHVRVHA
jgi:sarcosine oxidase subunit alpha